jgi:tetratricopeptide (TPR) repeat protein
MLSASLRLLAVALLFPTGAHAQVIQDPGDGRTGGLAANEDALAPLNPMVEVSSEPAEREAIEAYHRGLRFRDKAWQLEQEAAAAEGAIAAKKAAKARKAYLQAIGQFRSATERSPGFYQALGSLGYALLRTGQYREALEAYNQALTIGPSYPEAIEERGEVYLGLDQVENAKAAYLELSRVDCESAAKLMSAMKGWLESRRSESVELSVETLNAFSTWIEDRGPDVCVAADT